MSRYLSILLFISFTFVLNAQRPDIVPQLRHGADITAMCQDPKFTHVFTADNMGNVHQWELKSKRLLKRIQLNISRINFIQAFGGVGEYFIVVSSYRDKKLLFYDYNADTLISQFSFSDSVINVTVNYYNSAKSLNKYGKVLQVHTTKERILLNYDNKQEFKRFPVNGLDTAEATCYDEYATQIFTANNGVITHHKSTEYSTYSFRRYYLNNSDGKVLNLKYIEGKRMIAEALLVATEKSFYHIALTGKVTRLDRWIDSTNPGLFALKHSKERYFIKYNQLAYNDDNDEIVFGECISKLSEPGVLKPLVDALGDYSDALYAHSNYSVKDVIIGCRSNILEYTYEDDMFRITKEFGPGLASVKQLLSANGKLYLSNSDALWSYDLNKAEVEADFNIPLNPSRFLYNRDQGLFYLQVQNLRNENLLWNAFTYNSNSNQIVNALPFDPSNKLSDLAFYNNQLYYTYASDSTKIYMHDEGQKLIIEHKAPILDFALDETGVYVLDKEGISRYKLGKTRMSKRYPLVYGKSIHLDKDGRFYVLGDYALHYYPGSGKYLKATSLFNQSDSKFKRLSNGQFGLILNDHVARYYIIENGEELSHQEFTRSELYDFDADSSGAFYFGFRNGECLIRKGDSELKLLIHSSKGIIESWVIYNDDCFYKSDKNAYQLVSFNELGKIVPLSHYDLFFNRPHVILEEIGSTDSDFIELMHRVFEKRSEKYSFNEDIFDPKSRPEFFGMDSATRVTSRQEIGLLFHANSSSSEIDKLYAYINGVPVYEWHHKELLEYFKANPLISKMPTTEISSMFDMAMMFRNLKNPLSDSNNLNRFRIYLPFELGAGENIIEIFCENELGIRSKTIVQNITYLPEKEIQPDLYVFAIGVSDYQDDRYDLKYARKDGRDILNAAKQNRLLLEGYQDFDGNIQEDVYRYGNVFIDSLFDQDVKLENLSKVADFFQGAKLEDRVILYVAGHGVLDDDLNFYYAGNDIDFKDPRARGISYDLLEQVLKSSPSRQRILLMDACHSGEVDKTATDHPKHHDLVDGARGVFVNEEEPKLGLQNSFELMKEVFADVSRGSGIYVIAAAAGNSYALESSEWKNGVFTYCILQSLRKSNDEEVYSISKDEMDLNRNGIIDEHEYWTFLRAINTNTFENGYNGDLNQDESVSVLELLNYVSRQVEDMTDGFQKPTSRAAMAEFDFVIW
ncbi:hypothetical protein GYB22_07615 [bacterium]|nr:hypothetical protein [bacterium]